MGDQAGKRGKQGSALPLQQRSGYNIRRRPGVFQRRDRQSDDNDHIEGFDEDCEDHLHQIFDRRRRHQPLGLI